MALALAALACLAGAFVGLATNGFWIDELFTAHVVGRDHDAAAALGRALIDTHPPTYYLALFGLSGLFGTSEAALRLPSAVCAVAALVLFFFGTRRFYSVPARLVAIMLAVTSRYWLFQSQNARSYALVMLLATVLLVLAMRWIDRDRAGTKAPATLAALVLVSLVGVFVHYYMLFVELAVILVMMAMSPRFRLIGIALGAVLTACVFGYVEVVMKPHSVFANAVSWMGNDVAWYRAEVQSTLASIANRRTAVAMLVILAGSAGFTLWRRPERPTIDARWLPVAVPFLVLAAGIASSQIMAPNVTARNLLVAVPFVWAAIALLYDLGVARLGARRWVAMLMLAGLALASVTSIRARLKSTNTPFRETAQWIARNGNCAGATIPVFVDRNSYVSEPIAMERVVQDYGYYTDPSIRLRGAFAEDAFAPPPAGEKGCVVVGWAMHYVIGKDSAEALRGRIEAGLGRPVTMRVFGERAYIYLAAP